MGEKVKKLVKTVKVNLDECNGCRGCEMVCASFHAKPKYSNSNPYRSRVRLVIDERAGVWVPIRSTDYSKAECDGRRSYIIKGREYSQCSFCGTICPARDLFKEPDSGLPLMCDMCESDPPQEEPMCVQACQLNALTYVEEEVWVDTDTQEKPTQVEVALKFVVNEYGIDATLDTMARLVQK